MLETFLQEANIGLHDGEQRAPLVRLALVHAAAYASASSSGVANRSQDCPIARYGQYRSH